MTLICPYHQGRIVFTYLGDIWRADETGLNVKRVTVHKARDVYPRFSPDGRWIAFSSDRHGNLVARVRIDKPAEWAEQVRAGDNYWPLLNSTSRLNRKVEVTFNNKPSEDGAWKARIEPFSTGSYSQARDERWVRSC